VQGSPTSSIQYTAWDKSPHSARLSGGWWVDTDATGKSSLTTSIAYLDPSGRGWIGSRSGREFLTVRFASTSCTDNPVESLTASSLTYVDWNGKPTTASLPSPATAWVIGGSQANIGGNFPAYYNAATNGFEKVDGGATIVRVGPGGQPWLVNAQGAIFRRKASSTGFLDGTWQTMPGQASDIAIGADGSVWAIGPVSDVANIGGSHVYWYSALSNDWQQVDGGAVAIAVGPDGQPWIVNKQGTIFNRTRGQTGYVDGAWQTVPGQATAIAAGADGSVWVIGVLEANIGGNIIYRYNPSNPGGWDQIDGGGVAIGVGPDGQPWLVNKQGALFARGKGNTSYVDGTWTTIAPSGAASAIGVGGSF
jgi:hypothetical protein